jgi:DNA-binding SARP family transcriptional activator
VDDFRVFALGPLQVYRRGTPIRLGPQLATLFSVLLLESGRWVPAHRLVDLLWAAPPERAPATLRSHVSHLRRALRSAGPDGADLVTTVGSGSGLGYGLDLPADQVDVHRFEHRYAEGRRLLLRRETAQAATLFRDALSLWRGPAFADVADRPFAWSKITGLNATRLAARRSHAEALLALGRHAEVVGELTGAVTDEPYDEGLRRLLALALYHQQRVDEAVAVCRDGLHLLHQRGIDAPDLTELQRTILRRGVPTGEQWPVMAEPPLAPCLLPPPPTCFVGRRPENGEAMRVLGDAGTRPASLVLTGPAGVGKTAFALRVAHALAEQFPDGQLYADLCGATREPTEPPAVLATFLRALGVPTSAVPADPTDRLRLYRSLLGRRRILAVLDDAASARQVRDLVPNGAHCVTLVTSRTCLADLDGVHLPLGILDLEEALSMLADMLGEARMAAEPAAARRIVQQCGYLPLAMWVAGARLAARPHQRLSTMVGVLADERRRLDELAVGDVAVRPSVELTYRGLDGTARRALRLLGLLGGPDFAPWSLAALLDVPLPRAERLIDDLFEVHLLDAAASDGDAVRYRLHDLTRVFARERAVEEESGPDRHTALRRLLGACLGLAQVARARLTGEPLHPDHRPPPGTPAEADVARLVAYPLAWFDRECRFLIAAIGHRVDDGLADVADRLADTLTPFFRVRNLDPCRQ